jgi:hypothetical protein
MKVESSTMPDQEALRDAVSHMQVIEPEQDCAVVASDHPAAEKLGKRFVFHQLSDLLLLHYHLLVHGPNCVHERERVEMSPSREDTRWLGPWGENLCFGLGLDAVRAITSLVVLW